MWSAVVPHWSLAKHLFGPVILFVWSGVVDGALLCGGPRRLAPVIEIVFSLPLKIVFFAM